MSLLKFAVERPAWRLAMGAMLLGFAPIMVRASASPPTTAAFYRMLLGGLMLLSYLVITRCPVMVRRQILIALFASGSVFAFDLFFWHRSIHLVGPGLATLLAGFQVFIMAIVGIALFGERFRWQLAVAIPVGLAGVALIIGIDWSALTPGYQIGVVFGLATAVTYSIYLLTMRWARGNASSGTTPMAEVAWMSLGSAAVLAMLTFVTGESLAITTGSETILLAGYALLAQLGLVIISSSLTKVPTSLIGLLLLLEPIFAYLWELLIFSRPVSILEIVGVILALSAIYLGSKGAAA